MNEYLISESYTTIEGYLAVVRIYRVGENVTPPETANPNPVEPMGVFDPESGELLSPDYVPPVEAPPVEVVA